MLAKINSGEHDRGHNKPYPGGENRDSTDVDHESILIAPGLVLKTKNQTVDNPSSSAARMASIGAERPVNSST